MVTWATIYQDRFDTVNTTIRNDGHRLEMTVRGIVFAGTDFDLLSPAPDQPADGLSSFTMCQGDLCSCTIECTIPLPIVLADGTTTPVQLRATIALGDPDPERGGLVSQSVALALSTAFGDFHSAGDSGWFEDELLELQSKLPDGLSLKACITCAFSDYSPYGHGLFGDLACFRGNKAAYRDVRSKGDLFRIWDTATEFVQETHLCSDYARRQPGTGYRG